MNTNEKIAVVTCAHNAPLAGWGASQVTWGNNGVGSVALPCAECGKTIIWQVTE